MARASSRRRMLRRRAQLATLAHIRQTAAIEWAALEARHPQRPGESAIDYAFRIGYFRIAEDLNRRSPFGTLFL